MPVLVSVLAAADKARSLWHKGASVSATMRYSYPDVLGSHEHECPVTWWPDSELWSAPAELDRHGTYQILGFSDFQLLELPE